MMRGETNPAPCSTFGPWPESPTIKHLRAQVAAVEALADEWEREAGEASEWWRVFGPQSVSVPFAVEQIRAALKEAGQ